MYNIWVHVVIEFLIWPVAVKIVCDDYIMCKNCTLKSLIAFLSNQGDSSHNTI